MEAKDYKDHIIQIVTNNNIKAVEILAELIYQADQAKQVLRDKGYGWTGLSLLKTVQDEATYENKIFILDSKCDLFLLLLLTKNI